MVDLLGMNSLNVDKTKTFVQIVYDIANSFSVKIIKKLAREEVKKKDFEPLL